MIYTQQKRRKFNKATERLFPGIGFKENTDGVPVMECDCLPEGVVPVLYEDTFIAEVINACVKSDGIYRSTDNRKAVPVFIQSTELDGNKTRIYWRINYVSADNSSFEQVAEYIMRGKLYAEKKIRTIQF